MSLQTPDAIRTLQRKLYGKAKTEPGFRFYTLYDRITRDDVLMTAWWLVLAHDGAPGVDGLSCQDIIDGPGATVFLEELRDELITKRNLEARKHLERGHEIIAQCGALGAHRRRQRPPQHGVVGIERQHLVGIVLAKPAPP